MLKKKVLFIADHLKGGGAERILLDTASSLSETNEVIIALLDSKDIRMKIPSNIQIIGLGINHKFMTGSLWRRGNRNLTNKEKKNLNELIQHIEPDIIILTHWYAFHILPHIIGNIWVWVHGEIFNPKRKHTTNVFRWYKETRRIYLERKNFPRLLNGKQIIFVNQDLQKNYLPYLPLAKSKVIYNGIYLNSSEIVLHNDKATQWDCIFLGRLSPEKQPDKAIYAFSKSQLTGKMVIVGDGSMLNQLIELTKALNIQDRVDFVGWQEDVQSYIQKSALLLMSSLAEGYGLVISESLALNTPVVAFNCSDGVNFQLNSGQLSRGLVPAQDMDQLIETINNIYLNPYPITPQDKERLSINRLISDFNQLI